MPMVTRLQAKKQAVVTKAVEGSVENTSSAPGNENVKHNRHVLNDIGNKIGSIQNLKTQAIGTYKTEKSHVEKRNKKIEDPPQRSIKNSTYEAVNPASKQCSKPRPSAKDQLGQKIDNIDGKEVEDPQLVSIYANDIYAYLFKLENKYPIKRNFLANQKNVTPNMRSVLLDWIIEVHEELCLKDETFYMTVSMIDRYLQSEGTTLKRYLQLVGVTALFMASKYEEETAPVVEKFIYSTADTYSKQQIFEMERKIFKTLDFNLSKPLPIDFLRRFTKAAGTLVGDQKIAANYFMELASIDYEMAHYKPSQIAATSLYLSLFIFNGDEELWTKSLEKYITYTYKGLKVIVKRLAFLAVTAKDSQFQSVYMKYSKVDLKIDELKKLL